MSSNASLAARIAMGLTASLFDGPVRLGDVRLIALGRLHLWDGWETLDDVAVQSVSRFLGLRPEALGEDAGLMDVLTVA